MKNLSNKLAFGFAWMVVCQCALANFADVPAFQPSWRGMAGSTLQKWSFTATPTNYNGDVGGYYGPEVTLPSVVSNPNGMPTASIVADQIGVGWFFGDGSDAAQVSSTNHGWWDLGFNAGGSINLSIPTAGGPSGSIRYIWVQVTEATNSSLLFPATVSVSGGTQIGTVQTTLIEHYAVGIPDDVVVFQSVWQVPGNLSSYTVTVTGASGAASDTAIGGIVVDTSGHPPVANNVTYTRATNLTWKIKSSDLATNAAPIDTGDTLSVVAAAGALHGTVGLISGGTYVGYTPVPLTQALPDTFIYTVQDNQNGLQASATVTLNMTPQQPGLSLQITNNGGQITVTAAGIPGYTYDIQRGSNVTFSPNFDIVRTTNAPSGGVFIYVDPSPPQPTAYYRLKQH